jgi:uncharacterized membrane protein HdeD (DUF308 family)
VPAALLLARGRPIAGGVHPTGHLPVFTARRAAVGDPWISALSLTQTAVRTARRWLVAAGILAVAGGVAAIIVPAVASVAVTAFLGWVLVVGGLANAMHAFPLRGRAATRLVVAPLALAVGLWLIAFPLSATITLTVLLAVWFFGAGALLLLEAWVLRDRPGAALVAVHGTLSIILGILLVASIPSRAPWALGLLVGVNVLFWGIRALVAASFLGRAITS